MDFAAFQRGDFINAVGRVGRRKLARLDLSHPYQHAFLERGLMRRRLVDEELDPVLDQAMMYSSGITTMVLGEMADVAETLEGRVFHNMDMQDVRMNEVEREVEELQDQVTDDHATLGQLEVENADLRYRNNVLFTRVERLEEQVRNLMLWRAVLQHGPGNPVEVIDDEEEIVPDSEDGDVRIEEGTPEAIVEVRAMSPEEFAGRLVPIEDVEVPQVQEIWEDERNFRRDRAEEDVDPVPGYVDPPEYIPPPVYD